MIVPLIPVKLSPQVNTVFLWTNLKKTYVSVVASSSPDMIWMLPI